MDINLWPSILFTGLMQFDKRLKNQLSCFYFFMVVKVLKYIEHSAFSQNFMLNLHRNKKSKSSETP